MHPTLKKGFGSAAVVGNQLYFVQNGARITKFDPEVKKWGIVREKDANRRSGYCVVALHNKLVLIGGHGEYFANKSNEVDVYNVLTDDFAKLPPLIEARYEHVCAYIDLGGQFGRGLVVMAGLGRANEHLKSVEFLPLDKEDASELTQKWLQLPDLRYSHASYAGLGVFNGGLFIFGGYSYGNGLRSVEEFVSYDVGWKVRGDLRLPNDTRGISYSTLVVSSSYFDCDDWINWEKISKIIIKVPFSSVAILVWLQLQKQPEIAQRSCFLWHGMKSSGQFSEAKWNKRHHLILIGCFRFLLQLRWLNKLKNFFARSSLKWHCSSFTILAWLQLRKQPKIGQRICFLWCGMESCGCWLTQEESPSQHCSFPLQTSTAMIE